MDGKLDGYKLDRYKLLDLIEWAVSSEPETELQKILPITVQLFVWGPGEKIFSETNSHVCVCMFVWEGAGLEAYTGFWSLIMCPFRVYIKCLGMATLTLFYIAKCLKE